MCGVTISLARIVVGRALRLAERDVPSGPDVWLEPLLLKRPASPTATRAATASAEVSESKAMNMMRLLSPVGLWRLASSEKRRLMWTASTLSGVLGPLEEMLPLVPLLPLP